MNLFEKYQLMVENLDVPHFGEADALLRVVPPSNIKDKMPLSTERGKGHGGQGTEKSERGGSPCPPAHPACSPGEIWPDPPPMAHQQYDNAYRRYLDEANRVGEEYDWGRFGLFESCGLGCWTVGPFYAIDGQQYNVTLRWSGGGGGGYGQHGTGGPGSSKRGSWQLNTELTGETCVTCFDAWRGTHW